MASSGKIEAEVAVKVDQRSLSKASQQINQGLSHQASTTSLPSPTPIPSRVTRSTSGVLHAGGIPASKFFEALEKHGVKPGAEQYKFMHGEGAFATPYTGAVPPRVGSFAAWWGANRGTMTQAGRMAGFGGAMNVGMLARAGAAGAVAAGVIVAMMLVQKAFQRMAASVEDSRRLYAESLASGGLPLGFVAQRRSLAKVMGVNERDVYHYSAAGQLASRMAYASSVSAATGLENTGVAWSKGVRDVNMGALRQSLMANIAPEVRIWNNAISGMARAMTEFSEQYRKSWFRKLHFGLAEYVAGKMGFETGPAQPPGAFAMRYQASSWERMGMVVGGGSPDQRIAQNTAMIASNTKQMAQSLFALIRSGGIPGMVEMSGRSIVHSIP